MEKNNKKKKKRNFIGKEDEVNIAKMKEVLLSMGVPSKAEEGVIFYEIFQYKNNPRKFMAYESWESEAALDGHKASAHYAVYKSSYEPYCEHKYTDELEVLG